MGGHSANLFVYRALEHGLLPPADRAAAESDVAGLGSEAMATLCVEWLKPLLQHSDSDESSPAKTCRSVRRPGQAHTDGSAGLLPCQPGRRMYGAAAELQLCPSRHAVAGSTKTPAERFFFEMGLSLDGLRGASGCSAAPRRRTNPFQGTSLGRCRRLETFLLMLMPRAGMGLGLGLRLG